MTILFLSRSIRLPDHPSRLLGDGSGHLGGDLVHLFGDGRRDVVCGLVGPDGGLLLGSDPDGLFVHVLDLLGGRGVELQDPTSRRGRDTVVSLFLLERTLCRIALDTHFCPVLVLIAFE